MNGAMIRQTFDFNISNDDENVREASVEKNGLNVEVEAEWGPSASEAFACHKTALK